MAAPTRLACAFPFRIARVNVDPQILYAATKQKVEEVVRMPQQAWSKKRERQYEHIKDGLHERGDAKTRPRRSRRGR